MRRSAARHRAARRPSPRPLTAPSGVAPTRMNAGPPRSRYAYRSARPRRRSHRSDRAHLRRRTLSRNIARAKTIQSLCKHSLSKHRSRKDHTKAHLPSLTDATKGRACSHADAYSGMRHVHARCIRFVNATLLSSSQHCPECRRCACHLASASRSRPASPPLTCRRRRLGRRARRRSQTCRPRGTSWSCSGSSSPHRECQAPHGTAASSLHTAG